MQIFQITRRISIACESVGTRSGFKHVARLMLNGRECDETKCCYQNRTWERYQFHDVLNKLVTGTKSLNDDERAKCKTWIANYGKEAPKTGRDQTNRAPRKMVKTESGALKAVAMVAAMGDVFGGSRRESNDWKARMLKAGLQGAGLIMPDDWDTLSETVKEQRLNAAITALRA